MHRLSIEMGRVVQLAAMIVTEPERCSGSYVQRRPETGWHIVWGSTGESQCLEEDCLPNYFELVRSFPFRLDAISVSMRI